MKFIPIIYKSIYAMSSQDHIFTSTKIPYLNINQLVNLRFTKLQYIFNQFGSEKQYINDNKLLPLNEIKQFISDLYINHESRVEILNTISSNIVYSEYKVLINKFNELNILFDQLLFEKRLYNMFSYDDLLTILNSNNKQDITNNSDDNKIIKELYSYIQNIKLAHNLHNKEIEKKHQDN